MPIIDDPKLYKSVKKMQMNCMTNQVRIKRINCNNL